MQKPTAALRRGVPASRQAPKKKKKGQAIAQNGARLRPTAQCACGCQYAMAGRERRQQAVAAACAAAAAALGLLALLWRAAGPASGGEGEVALGTAWAGGSRAIFDQDSALEDQKNPFRRIGNAFHFFDVKGFDADSLHRRVRIDAADQDANAALQWQNAQRIHREGEGESNPPPEGEVAAPKKLERPTRHYDPDSMWITPFRQAEAESHFRAVAPPGFSRRYADHFGGDGRERSRMGQGGGGRAVGGGGGQAGSPTAAPDVRQQWASGMWPLSVEMRERRK